MVLLVFATDRSCGIPWHRLLRRILTGTKLPRVPITFPDFAWEKVVKEVVGVYEGI